MNNMTKEIKSNRPVFDAGKAIAGIDSRDDTARFKVFVAMRDAGANDDTLASKGAHYADLRDGYLTAWQGEAFATAFESANGKVMLKGKVMDARTGKTVTLEMPRVDWQRALSSKVDKARKSYLAWVSVTADSRNDEQPDGAATGAATGARAGSTKSVKDLCGDDLQKLWTRIMKDHAAKDAPELAIDHKAMLGFVKAAADLIKVKLNDPKLPK
jgi:hypothetical protein